MAPRVLKNYRVYVLTAVAYLGSLLFGWFQHRLHAYMSTNMKIQDMTRVL